MKIWYAVSGRGQGNVFTSYPVRSENFKIWQGRLEGCVSTLVSMMEVNGDLELPAMTWQDEPLELELTLATVAKEE